mmetsp:Transcript_2012/g.6294  ORF Transcript_2012/g.6294 Transcript_2012/m.6294 type:complete len:84 (+) Transcript_2012:784-1035(+)|eukprot:scaffold117031_cov37-Tisochrysis_lutea.AAC.4
MTCVHPMSESRLHVRRVERGAVVAMPVECVGQVEVRVGEVKAMGTRQVPPAERGPVVMACVVDRRRRGVLVNIDEGVRSMVSH